MYILKKYTKVLFFLFINNNMLLETFIKQFNHEYIIDPII